MPVKLVSFNIQFGRGLDGRYDLDRVADALTDADIACLQEVTTHWAACNGDHQPDLLSQRLGMYSVFASGFELAAGAKERAGAPPDNRRRAFGNLVLSRWPILYSRSHSLGRPPVEIPADFPDPRTDLPRCALEAVVDLPGAPVRVVSVHLSHLPGGQRADQIRTLHTLLDELPRQAPLWSGNDPAIEPWTQGNAAPPVMAETVLAGDFNFGPTEADYLAMTRPENGRALVDGWLVRHAEHEPTCVELDGSRSTLDYAFFTAGMGASVVDARVDDEVVASDHLPLLFTLDLP